MIKLGKVLLTDGSYKHTLASAISLKKAGYEVHVMGRKTNVCRFSLFVDKFLVGNYFYEYKIDDLINLLKHEKYDVILAVSGKSVKYLSKNSEVIHKYSKFIVSDIDTIECALDKISSSEIAAELLINTIPFAYSDSIDDLYQKSLQLTFPLVLKSKDELKKSSVFYINDKSELKRSICQYYAKYDFLPLVQQYIEGDGYGYFSLNIRGVPLLNFAHKRIREAPASGGVSSCAEYYEGSDVMEMGRKLMEKLKWNGLSMVEFKKEKSTGKLFLMEINPKLWGSLDLAIECYANFPLKYVEICQGNYTQEEIEKRRLRFSWIATEEILHFFTRFKSIKPILSDMVSKNVITNFRVNDPVATVFSIFISFLLALKYLLKDNFIIKQFFRLKRTGFKYFLIRFFTEKLGIPYLKYGRLSKKIYIGGQPSKLGLQCLYFMGFTHVINLRDEFSYDFNGLLVVDQFPIVEFDAVSKEELYRITSRINEIVLDTKSKIYIHCTEGVGRAPMIGVSYLMSLGNDLKSSYQRVKNTRPFISFVKLQYKSLVELENFLK